MVSNTKDHNLKAAINHKITVRNSVLNELGKRNKPRKCEVVSSNKLLSLGLLLLSRSLVLPPSLMAEKQSGGITPFSWAAAG